MLAVEIALFVKRLTLSELVFSNQAALEQQIHGVVQGSPTHAVVLGFHGEVEGLNSKMIYAGVNFFEYGIAFGRFSLPVGLQKVRKNLADLLVGLVIHWLRNQAAKVQKSQCTELVYRTNLRGYAENSSLAWRNARVAVYVCA